MCPVIGIDLGTTNSAVAVMEGGQPTVIANAEGNRTTPSVVHFSGGTETIVGDLAKRLLVPEPGRTIKSIKRFMGLRFSETVEQRRYIHYNISAGEKDEVRVKVGDREVTPEIVSAEVLKKMKSTAEDYLGQRVDQAVVTVPAYFTDTQRQATKLAGELAGLEILRILNEPTAACLAYGIDTKKSEKICVFDFGGGTFDVSLLEISENGVFEVRSTCGDNGLGGDTLDAMVAEYLEEDVQRQTGLKIAEDIKARQRLVDIAEKTKCELSTLESTQVSLPFLGMSAEGEAIHYNRELTREDFEKIIGPALERLVHPCRQALNDADWDTEDVAKVLLVGGSTRIPAVRRIAKKLFGKEPSQEVNPDEVVAMGAAIQGSVLLGGLKEVLLLDITPLSLGIASQGGVFNVIIPRNSSIPTEVHRPFTTVRDYQASVKIAIFQGERKMAIENRLLSEFRLEKITPAPKGLPHIDVTFRIDANGILNVSASDISTGARQEVRIDSFMAGKDEAERLIKAAEQNSEKDKAFMQRTALYVRALKLQEAVQMMLAESEKKINPEDAKAMKEAMIKIDVAFHLGDVHGIDQQMGALAELADKQGDIFLIVKTKLNMA